MDRRDLQTNNDPHAGCDQIGQLSAVLLTAVQIIKDCLLLVLARELVRQYRSTQTPIHLTRNASGQSANRVAHHERVERGCWVCWCFSRKDCQLKRQTGALTRGLASLWSSQDHAYFIYRSNRHVSLRVSAGRIMQPGLPRDRLFVLLSGEEFRARCGILLLWLELDAIQTHKWIVIRCSAMTGLNLKEGLEWIVQDARERYFLYWKSQRCLLVTVGFQCKGQTERHPVLLRMY